MKKALQRSAIVLSIGTLCFASCSGDTEKNEESNETQLQAAALTPAEDTIDFEGYPVLKKSGDSLRLLFRSDIRLNNALSISDTGDIIAVGAFEKLIHLSSNLATSSTANYIRCIGITYGLSASKIKLYYKPVLLTKHSGPTVKQNALYTPTFSTDFYEYSVSGDTFALAAKDIVKQAIKSYTTNVTFKDPTASLGYRRYNTANDSTGDVRMVVYPFQELDSIVTAHTASEIYFFNIGQTFKAGGINYLRHNILIGSDDVLITKELFYSKYGNLSHLCPPSCSFAKFNLIQNIHKLN